MNWFKGCSTVGEIKSLFRDLMKRWHPDLGTPDDKVQRTETSQDIIGQYKKSLEGSDGETSYDATGKEHTYHYDPKTESEIMAKVLDLLRLRMNAVKIELIGTWVWCSGDTKPHKDLLKAAGMFWNDKRKMWAWHLPTYKHHYSGIDTDVLRRVYGVKEFEQKENEVANVG